MGPCNAVQDAWRRKGYRVMVEPRSPCDVSGQGWTGPSSPQPGCREQYGATQVMISNQDRPVQTTTKQSELATPSHQVFERNSKKEKQTQDSLLWKGILCALSSGQLPFVWQVQQQADRQTHTYVTREPTPCPVV